MTKILSPKVKHATYFLQATVLSPFHIGTGEELTATGEYLTTKEKIYFLRHEELMKILQEKNLFDDYVQKILEAGNNFDFDKILREEYLIPYTNSEMNLIEREIRVVEKNLSVTSNNNLSLCIKTNQQAYIPGSSIKGMLRTAILYHVLKNNSLIKSEAENEINEILITQPNNVLEKVRRKWRDLEDGSSKKAAILPKEVFTTIRPYDSSGLEDKQLAVYQVYRQHLYDAEIGGVDWLVEAIQKDVELNFELTFYPNQIQQFGNFPFIQQPNLTELFNVLNDCSKTMIEFELQLIKQTKAPEEVKKSINYQLNEYKKQIDDADGKYAIVRMGKGKSLFYQTILPILREDIGEKIIHLLKKDKAHFPQSIVLTAKDYLMMGWMKLEMAAGAKQIPVDDYNFEEFNEEVGTEEDVQPPKKVIKITPPEERKTHDNKITTPLQRGTKLKIYFYESGNINLTVNGKSYNNAQLNKSKIKFPKQGDLVEVVVKQYSEAKGFVQLALI